MQNTKTLKRWPLSLQHSHCHQIFKHFIKCIYIIYCTLKLPTLQHSVITNVHDIKIKKRWPLPLQHSHCHHIFKHFIKCTHMPSPLIFPWCMYAARAMHIKRKPRWLNWGGGDSSVVRAPDSWLKGRGFESLLENFLLQGRLSVLTLISVSVPPPCYHSST